MTVDVAVLDVDHLDTILQTVEDCQRVGLTDIQPVGIGFKIDVCLAFENGVDHLTVFMQMEFMCMVVVLQGNAFCCQLGSKFIAEVNKFLKLFGSGKVSTGNDVVLVADDLVVLDSAFKIVTQFGPGGVGGRADQTVLVEPALDGFCVIAEETCEFNVLITDFRNSLQSSFQILGSEVADRI